MDTLKDYNVEQVLKKYTTGTWPVIRQLQDGGEVIGDAVDENNALLYVIRRGDEITLEHAENQKVVYVQRRSVAQAVRPT